MSPKAVQVTRLVLLPAMVFLWAGLVALFVWPYSPLLDALRALYPVRLIR